MQKFYEYPFLYLEFLLKFLVLLNIVMFCIGEYWWNEHLYQNHRNIFEGFFSKLLLQKITNTNYKKEKLCLAFLYEKSCSKFVDENDTCPVRPPNDVTRLSK